MPICFQCHYSVKRDNQGRIIGPVEWSYCNASWGLKKDFNPCDGIPVLPMGKWYTPLKVFEREDIDTIRGSQILGDIKNLIINPCNKCHGEKEMK